MITVKSFILNRIGEFFDYTNEPLYIISYGDHTMYVGQCIGKGGYNLPCRVKRHFGIADNSCMRINDRSGASRQFNTMLSRLPENIRDQFTVAAIQVHDLSHFVDLDSPEIRLKMIGSGISIDDIRNNKRTKKVINFCETVLAWSLCPVYDKSHNSRCSNGLPEELIKYLLAV